MDKVYLLAHEANKMKCKFYANGTVISIPTKVGKGHLSRIYPFLTYLS